MKFKVHMPKGDLVYICVIIILALLCLVLMFTKPKGINVDCKKSKLLSATYEQHPNNAILTRTVSSDYIYAMKRNNLSSGVLTADIPYIDYERPLKDATTDFVVEELFSSSDTLFNFLQLVITTHEDALDKYKLDNGLKEDDIIFIYKGGHILRIIGNEMFNNVPLKAGNILRAFYGPYIKRNDADFSIYINTHTFPLNSPEFNKIVEDVGEITYALQKDYRSNIFLPNSEIYFNFFRYNTAYQTGRLNAHVSAYSNSSTVSDPLNEVYYKAKIGGIRIFSSPSTTPPLPESKFWNSVPSDYPPNLPVPPDYEGKNDLIITVDPTSPIGVKTVTDTDKEWPIYVQNNTTLNFDAGGGISRVFNLMRSKVIINYRVSLYDSKTDTYHPETTHAVGGELIDVSIGRDFAVDELFEHLSSNIKKYQLSYKGKVLSFYSYSIKYLADDICIMLFKAIAYPWDDRKYEKRLCRLVFLCFIEAMSAFKTIKDISEYLHYMLVNIFTPLEKVEGVKLNAVVDSINSIKAKYPRMLFNLLLDESVHMINTKVYDTDTGEFKKYNGTVVTNLKILLNSIGDVHDYICDQGSININSLYETSFDSLI